MDRKPNVEKVDLDVLESRFGFSFPDDLREFYLRGNGGRPMPNLFPKEGEYFSVHEFLPIKHGMRGALFEDTYADLISEGGFFPKMAIPFAIDAGGDYFYYSLEPGKFGEICFYQSDYVNDPSRAIVHLAPSLREFLDGLVVE
ncbi:SMI1/KNR4 family protein [Ralstonia pseudosolanacearum]|uniref:SMI1/KNR4 family protein n=1 Tax=Ralstonia pseudosolanacearum TaxID=1310165 RepID=UPI003CFAB6FD